jgi:ParB family transcriptional regulator, chromosome partitioning protein
MSGKAKDLMNRFGGNIAQVVAARPDAAQHDAAAAPDRYEGALRSRAFGELSVDAVGRDETQPREDFGAEDLARLASSIRRFGQLAPIRVRRDEAAGRWVVLVGERRLRPCKLAGLERVRVEFIERVMTEADILAEQVVENVARADLRPVEEGRAYRRLMDLEGWTVEQLAETLGIEPTTAHHRLGLLRLPDDVAARVDAGEIRATAAYEISKLQIADEQREVAELVVAEGLDYKATAAEVARRKSPKGAKPKSRGGKASPRKTEASVRTSAGRVTVENRKGVDDEVMLAAMLEGVEMIRARRSGRTEAA